MFKNKNKISNQNTYQRNIKKNYGFSCSGTTNQNFNQNNQMFFYKNNNSYPSNGSENGMFSSLHKELNNNINSINRQGRMFNSMFQTKRGCGCRGKK